MRPVLVEITYNSINKTNRKSQVCAAKITQGCTRFFLRSFSSLIPVPYNHSSFNLPHLHWNHSAPPSADHVAPADWADLKFLIQSKQARPVWSGSVLILLMTLSSITRAYLFDLTFPSSFVQSRSIFIALVNFP